MSTADRVLLQLHETGLSPKQIGQRLGLSKGQVYSRLIQLGVAKKSMRHVISLTAWEEAVLLGTMMGDGHLRRRHPTSNAHLSFGHSEKQEDWLRWKVEQLSELFTDVEPGHHEEDDGHRAVTITSRASALLSSYYDLFYENRLKVVRETVLTKIKEHEFLPVILAVWFGDDGYKTTHACTVGYVLGGWTQEEQERVAQFLCDLGYAGKRDIHLKRTTYSYYRFCADASQTFKTTVGAYLPDCMQYKLDIKRSTRRRRN